jgi:hypothetical protein
MSLHTYRALKVLQQAGAPPFYLTAAPAAEILEWCDVPRAKGDYMAGYQRSLDTRRTQDLAEYIRQSPSNIVPGAVIVAVDSDYATIIEQPDGLYTVAIANDTRTFDEKVQELWGSFITRLGDEELTSAGIAFSVPPPESVGPQGNVPNPTEPYADDSDIPSYDADVADDLVDASAVQGTEDDETDDGSYPTSYLASLAEELDVTP